MKTIEVYDPPMCCSTGVCGTTVDPKLARFAGDLDWLKKQGVAVTRYNLAQQPAAFTQNAAVKAALTSHGNDCLPLILANGEIVTRSIYPLRDQLALLAGLPDSGSCCSGSGCC